MRVCHYAFGDVCSYTVCRVTVKKAFQIPTAGILESGLIKDKGLSDDKCMTVSQDMSTMQMSLIFVETSLNLMLGCYHS